MSEPDFTIGRAKGCFEHEVRNMYHLAILEEKTAEVIDKKKLLRDQRDKIIQRLWTLKMSSDGGAGGHMAGWNAAIDEAVRTIDGTR